MQGGQLADPVVAADRSGPAGLIDVDDVVRSQHGDVDGLPQLDREALADLPALLRDVELTRHRVGEAEQAEAEAILSALVGLFDQLVILQRRQETRDRGLVHADLGRELGDADLTEAGQDLEHGHGAVDGLHTSARVGAPVAHRSDTTGVALPGTVPPERTLYDEFRGRSIRKRALDTFSGLPHGAPPKIAEVQTWVSERCTSSAVSRPLPRRNRSSTRSLSESSECARSREAHPAARTLCSSM